MLAVVGLTVTDVTSVGAGGVTVIVALPALPDPSTAVAVMVAVPGATAVTVPSWVTVATLEADDDQVTARCAALDGATEAVRTWVPPTMMLAAVGLTVTDVTSVGAGGVTVIVALPDTPDPSTAVAVIIAVPGETAVTIPAEIVATLVSDDDQVMAGHVASDGATVNLKYCVPPTTRFAVAGLTVTDVTGIGVPVTVIVALPAAQPSSGDPSTAEAVMMAVPGPTACAMPSGVTCTTRSSEENQTKATTVASGGE